MTHERGARHACPALWELSISLQPHPCALRWGAAAGWSPPSRDRVASSLFCPSSITKDGSQLQAGQGGHSTSSSRAAPAFAIPTGHEGSQRCKISMSQGLGHCSLDKLHPLFPHPPPSQGLPASPRGGEKLSRSPSDKCRWDCSCAVPAMGQHLQGGSRQAAWHCLNLETLPGSHVTSAGDSNKLLFQIRERGTEKVRDKGVGGGSLTYYSQKWAWGYF